MKKLISLLLTVAMLTAALVIGVTPISAASTTHTAAYATVTPTIDGKIDAVWDTTNPMYFQYGRADADNYIKLLWTADKLYILGVLPDETSSALIAITEQKYTSTANNYDVGYAFKVAKDGTVTNPDWYSGAAKNLVTAVTENGSGFTFEAVVEKKYIANLITGNSIGLGAKCNNLNDVMIGAQWDFANYNHAPEKLASVTLVANPGLPQAAGKTVAMQGIQRKAAADGKYDVRLVAEIDKLDYASAGFDITVTCGDKTGSKDVSTTTAYTSLIAGEEKVVPLKDGNYLIAIEITGIPEDQDVTLTVTPYTVSGETKASGTAATYTLAKASSN